MSAILRVTNRYGELELYGPFADEDEAVEFAAVLPYSSPSFKSYWAETLIAPGNWQKMLADYDPAKPDPVAPDVDNTGTP